MKVLVCLFALVAAALAGAPSNEYLPPHHGAASAPQPSYASSGSFQSVAASAPAPSYQAAPAPSYQVAAAAPAPSYQPAPAPSFQVAASAPAPSFQAAPAPSYQAAPAPAASFQTASYEAAASEPAPAHTFSSDDGYRYKTHRRVVYRRHRRDVSHLPSNEYLPPHQGAASAPSVDYLPPHAGAASNSIEVAYEPAPAPVAAPSYQSVDYAPAESAPAHSYSSADGYRYKTHRRRVVRRRFRY